MTTVYSAAQYVEGFSHSGVCVTDLERSTRFYCEGLGFRQGALVHVDNQYHGLLGIQGNMKLHNHFIALGQMMIELIKFDAPELIPGVVPRPINQLGLTHLSFRVTDIDAVANKLEALGGKVFPASRTRMELPGMPAGDLIMCADPDGTRIELMTWPKEVAFA